MNEVKTMMTVVLPMNLSFVAADVRRTTRRNAGRRGHDVGGARTVLRPQRVRTAEGSERIQRPLDSRRAADAERPRSGVRDRRMTVRLADISPPHYLSATSTRAHPLPRREISFSAAERIQR